MSMHFVMEADASHIAIPVILGQNGQPVAFFSKILSHNAWRHTSVEKKAHDIVKSITSLLSTITDRFPVFRYIHIGKVKRWNSDCMSKFLPTHSILPTGREICIGRTKQPLMPCHVFVLYHLNFRNLAAHFTKPGCNRDHIFYSFKRSIFLSRPNKICLIPLQYPSQMEVRIPTKNVLWTLIKTSHTFGHLSIDLKGRSASSSQRRRWCALLTSVFLCFYQRFRVTSDYRSPV